jgi:hypothetical protein
VSKVRKEAARIELGEVPGVQGLERAIRKLAEDPAAKGGLPRLARAHHGGDGEATGEGTKLALGVAADHAGKVAGGRSH